MKVATGEFLRSDPDQGFLDDQTRVNSTRIRTLANSAKKMKHLSGPLMNYFFCKPLIRNLFFTIYLIKEMFRFSEDYHLPVQAKIAYDLYVYCKLEI